MKTMHYKPGIKRIVLLVWIVCVFGFISTDVVCREFQPEQFENKGRDEWQQVDRVIESMGLKEGDTIADIGGGSGYFSRPFAQKVGPKGVVYCCELAVNLMEYLQRRSLDEGLLNIVTVLAAVDRPMLPPQSVDHIFFCDTNHHLTDRVNYYKGLIPILKPGGQLVVVDFKKEGKKQGPPPEHCVAKSVVLEEMEQAGFQLVREETFLENQYFLIFKVKEKAGE